MDLVQFFEDLAAKYNSLKKCGFCWGFGAPLSESGMNKEILEDEEACCAMIFITDYQIGSEYRFSGSTQLQNYESCLHNFTIYVGQQVEDTGLNTYNEIPGHPITESLWKRIYKPLLDCLGCGKELYLCELGYDFDIIKWQMQKVQFKDDKNFTGWQIKGTFRVKA